MSLEQPESLVLGTGEQLALLEVDEAGVPAQAYELAERAGKFTGERIFSGNPKLYHAIVRLLARDVPYREIGEICSVSVNTVCAVNQREGTPIETIRQRIGRMGLDVAALTIEALRDMLADPDRRREFTMKDLAIAHGIAFSNAQLALGGATARLDDLRDKPKPTHDDYLAFVRNVTGTGSRVENPGTNGAQPTLENGRPGEVIDLPAAAPGAPDPAAQDPAKGPST